MEKQFLKILICGFLAFTSGCGPAEKEEVKSGIPVGYNLDPSTLKTTDGQLVGTGRYLFRDLFLPSLTHTATLRKINLVNNGSKLTLVFFTTQSSTLADGVHMTFTRSGGSVIGELEANATGVRTITVSKLSALIPNAFDVVIDFTAGQAIPHVVLYPMDGEKILPISFDSDKGSDLNAPLPATSITGNMVAMKLFDAIVGHAKFQIK